jgi:hypothetical protein
MTNDANTESGLVGYMLILIIFLGLALPPLAGM